MQDNMSDIEKILAEREKIDGILKSKFSKKISLMFTDIKGSTSFYDSRGDIDGRIMVHRHNEIVLPILTEYKGELLKTIGDATMTVFEEPVDAMNAAVKIQNTLREYNKNRQKGEQIHVRIGLNYGTVIVDKGDVFGDVVNVASRVESLADADEIFITDEMYRGVKGHDEFIFRYVDTTQVKGKKEAIKVYRVLWHEEALSLGRTRAVPAKEEGVFILEASVSGEALKISGFEREGRDERPVKGYRETRYNESKLKVYTKGIIDLLNRANKRGKISSDLLVKLKDYGRLLFDEIIPVPVKEKLVRTAHQHLLIHIDDRLVNIPWELLYDGKDFLCQRFSIGRSVSTKQQVSAVSRALGKPLKMQLLVDPGGDLKASYQEGAEIKKAIGDLDEWINLSLKSTDIKTDYVKAKMRNFDIVHYAGHAEHDAGSPEKSGWIMKDGKMSAEDIMSLTGAMPMPSLVFSNACQSGHTEEWKLDDDYEEKIFGLANAFLLSGVQHYIGTFWEIPDEAGSFFAINFYRKIIEGSTIGEAVREARKSLINKYGEDTIVWASYMLYGDPTTRYIYEEMDVREKKAPAKTGKAEFASPELRHKEEVIHLGDGKKNVRNVILGGIALLLAVFAAVFLIRWERSGGEHVRVVMPEKAMSAAEKEDRSRRINELVASLAGKYREGKFEQAAGAQDAWTSRPLTMVLMDIKADGSAGVNSRNRLVNLLPLALEGETRINMVEREILDKLLEELNLSASDLSDPATSLKLGKVLSANVIVTGSIIPDVGGHVVVLRFIDTETTAVKKVISAETKADELDRDEINKLGAKITEWVESEFVLRGKIEEVAGNRCRVNLGRIHGLQKGDRLEVLEEVPEGGVLVDAAEIEISELEKDEAWAFIIGDEEKIKTGSRVRERKE